MFRMVTVLIVGSCLAPPASAADSASGKAVFNRCRICHSLEAGGHGAAGPNLHGIFGRTAGAGGDFPYSAAMRGSGIVWDNATLAAYLHNPKRFMPGTRMAFPGIKDDREIADLLAYLRQATR